MAAELKENSNEDDGKCSFYFKLRNVPNDHSCLFHSIAYLVNHDRYKKDRNYHFELRKIAATAVSADAKFYEHELAALGKDANAYSKWIQDEFSWGGTLEVAVFAKHLQVDVVVIDVTANLFFVLDCGQEDADRIHIVYNGDHYDAVVGIADEEDDLNDRKEMRRFNRKELGLADWTRIEQQALQRFLDVKHPEWKRKKEELDKLKAKAYKCQDCDLVCRSNDEMAQHMNETEYEQCMFDEQ